MGCILRLSRVKRHQFNKTLCWLSMRHGLCTQIHNKIISLTLRKNAVFRVITEGIENLVKVS